MVASAIIYIFIVYMFIINNMLLFLYIIIIIFYYCLLHFVHHKILPNFPQAPTQVFIHLFVHLMNLY